MTSNSQLDPEIMATLTHIGVEPPSLDGWTYFDKQESDSLKESDS